MLDHCVRLCSYCCCVVRFFLLCVGCGGVVGCVFHFYSDFEKSLKQQSVALSVILWWWLVVVLCCVCIVLHLRSAACLHVLTALCVVLCKVC